MAIEAKEIKEWLNHCKGHDLIAIAEDGWQLEPGLYEMSQDGDRWFVMVRPNKNGSR